MELIKFPKDICGFEGTDVNREQAFARLALVKFRSIECGEAYDEEQSPPRYLWSIYVRWRYSIIQLVLTCLKITDSKCYISISKPRC